MNPAPPVIRRVRIKALPRRTRVSSCPPPLPWWDCHSAQNNSDRRALGILQRESQLLRERLDGRAGALPLPFGLEAQVADAAAPRRNDTADRTEITAIGVLLIQTADDVRRDSYERTERRR